MPQQLFHTNQFDQLSATDTTNFVVANPVNSNQIHFGFNSETNFNAGEIEMNLPPAPFHLKESQLGSSLFWVYLFIVFIWGIFFRVNFKTINNISRSFISNTAFFQTIEERRSFNGLASVGSFFIGLLVISIFVYQLLTLIPVPGLTPNLSFSSSYIVLIFVVLISITFIKSLLLWLSSWVFQDYKTFNAYLSLNVVSIQVLGLILFPLVLLFTYSYQISSLWLLNIGLLIIGIEFIVRLLRSFFLALKETTSQMFHIILYICALEILPLFVLSKLYLVS